MKRILFLLVMVLGYCNLASAQQFYITGGTSANSIPLGNSNNKVQWIYYPANFTSGTLSAGYITKVYFQASAAVNGVTFTNLKIKLGTTTLANTVTGNYMGGMTTVFNAASYVMNSPAAGAWIGITLQTPFYYNGTSNLVFEMSETGYTSAVSVYQSSPTGNRRLYGTVAGTGGTASTGLANFGFDLVPPSTNNAASGGITDPANFCAGTYDVKFLVRNFGTNTINNLQINWTLDGTPQSPVSYSNAIAPVTSSPANQALVTLGSVTFANTAHVVKAWTSQPNGVTDSDPTNDTANATLHAALNGTYTIGGTSPDYPSIDAAAADLNAYGICGPVTFNIRNGTYSNQRALIYSVAGAGATNRIVFKSETNNAANVIFADTATGTADNFIFKLSSASYVTLRDLTFKPVGTTYARAVELAGSASFDSVKNCVFNTATATSTATSRALIFADDLLGDGDIFSGNSITGGSSGIYCSGTSATAACQNPMVLNNTVTNSYYYGIYTYYCSNIKVRNNTITAASPYTTFYGLTVGYDHNAMEVTGNTITVTGGSTVYGLRNYYSDGTAAVRSQFLNNKVTVNATGTIYGVYNYYSSNNIFRNNLALTTTTGSNYTLYDYNAESASYYNNTFHSASSGSTNYCGYIYHSSATYANIDIKNNIFSVTATGGYPMYVYNPLYIASDYNNLYTPGTNVVYRGTTPAGAVASISAWRIASGLEKNSLSYRPGYTSATNLQPNAADTAVWSVNGRGIQIAGNNTDFNGNTRSTTLAGGVPDLGAYEVLPTSVPPAAIASPTTPAAGTTQVFTFGQDTVARISWATGSTVPAAVTVKQYSGTMAPALPAGGGMYFYTDVAASGGPFSYTPDVYYKDPWLGTVPNETAINMASRTGTAAWITYLAPPATINTTRNIMSVTGMTSVAAFTGRVDNCAGQPQAATITTAAQTMPLCYGDSLTLNATDPNNAAGIVYKWQRASSASGPWTNVSTGTGSNTLSYNTGALTDTVYFRITDTCTVGNLSAVSNVYMVPVVHPLVLTVTPGGHCGPGTVDLQATVSGNDSLRWFDVPTGGTLLGTGTTFTTPVLQSTDTFYVEARSGNCYSARTMVIATITPSIFTISNNMIVCNNEIAQLEVTSSPGSFSSYDWTPTTNLYTDAAATIPYTGGYATSLYAKTNIAGSYNYVAVASNPATQCNGADTVNVFVQPIATGIIATPDTICVSGTTMLSLVPATGYATGGVQWQDSATGSTAFTDITGAVNPTYTTTAITATKYYRGQVLNTNGDVCFQAVKEMYVNNPQIAGTTPGTRCGPGTVNLQATANAGSTINWFASATGGVALATGSPFTTPYITGTTTYYVAAGSGGGTYNVGKASSTGADGSNTGTGVGLVFNAITPFTLQSVKVYPIGTGAGSITVNLTNSAGTVLQSATVNVTGAATPGVLTTIPLNFSVPAGTGHKLLWGAKTGGVTGMIRDYSAGSGITFPYTIPGMVSITGGTTSTYYYYFYDWTITTECQGTRVPVTATVTPGPSFSVTDSQSVCNNNTVALTVTSPNGNYNTYSWSPATNLYTDAATTIPYTGGNASTVYAKTTTPGYAPYYAFALNTGSQCTAVDTLAIFNQPAFTAVTGLPDTLCVSGASTLGLTPVTGYFPGSIQWQSSPTGTAYTTITGATGETYNTGTISNTTYYRAIVKNSSGGVCGQHDKIVVVNNPQLTSTTPGARCGVGTVTLSATGTPANAVMNWYTSATANTPVAAGSSFTTPFLYNTTTYYVASVTGGGTGIVGPPDPASVGSYASFASTYHMEFDVLANTVLQSVDVFPTVATGTNGSIKVMTAAGVLVQEVFYVTNVTGGTTAQTVIMNVPLAPGSYYLVQGTSIALQRNTAGASYPYTSPAINITGNNFGAGYFYHFYNWRYNSGCESPRQAVIATINPAPAVSLSPAAPAICFGDTAYVVPGSVNSGYTYHWSPVAQTGTLHVSPSTNTDYYLYATDSSGGANNGCVLYDTVTVTVNPLPVAIVTPDNVTTFCGGDSVRLFATTDTTYTYQWQKNGVDITSATDTVYTVTSSGNYTVTVTKNGICSLTSAIENVTVHPLPNPVITWNNGMLTTGSFAAYQWLLNGQIIAGATGQNFQPVQSADYSVAVTDANGCTNTSSTFRYFAAGIPGVNGVGGPVTIYPNPTTGVINISSPAKIKIAITTMDGRMLMNKEDVKQIDISSLADGVYMIRITDMDGALLKVEKLVKAAQ